MFTPFPLPVWDDNIKIITNMRILSNPCDRFHPLIGDPVDKVQDAGNQCHQQSFYAQHLKLEGLQAHVIKISQKQREDTCDDAVCGYGIGEDFIFPQRRVIRSGRLPSPALPPILAVCFWQYPYPGS